MKPRAVVALALSVAVGHFDWGASVAIAEGNCTAMLDGWEQELCGYFAERSEVDDATGLLQVRPAALQDVKRKDVELLRSDGGCTKEEGNVFADQICRDDTLYAEIQRQAIGFCACGESDIDGVPQFVIDDSACLSKVLRTASLPTWTDYFFASVNCLVAQGFKVAANREITCPEPGLALEHVPHALLRDNNPATRLTFQNLGPIPEPSPPPFDIVTFAIGDVRLHLLTLRALRGDSKKRYWQFVLWHLVGVSFDIEVRGRSGADAWLRAFALFSRNATLQQLQHQFAECRGVTREAASTLHVGSVVPLLKELTRKRPGSGKVVREVVKCARDLGLPLALVQG